MSPARRRAERKIAEEQRLRDRLEEQADDCRRGHAPGRAQDFLDAAIEAGQRIQRIRRQLTALGPEEHAEQLSLFTPPTGATD